MNKILRVKFEDDHARGIVLRDYESRIFNRDWLINVNTYGKILTYMWGDDILAIGGFFEKWKGVARVFVVPSIHTSKCPKSFVQTAREAIDTLYNDLSYHRLETESKADEQTDKWMKFLGFECEGTLRKWSAIKDDWRLWSRVK
jgi:hypothetical protein